MLLPQLLLLLQDMLLDFFFFKHQADVSSTGIDLHASEQTLLHLLSLLLLLRLWFLLSFLIVVLLLQPLLPHIVVNQFKHLRRSFLSHLFSLLSSRFVKVRILLQHSCAIDGAPHCLVLRRHSDPHPDDDLFVQSALLPPTDYSALTTHHHRHITIRIEHRRDHMHERIIPSCKL